MSVVRCPMCGKLNPEDAEICQFCQARIKPILVDPGAVESTESLGKKAAESQEISSTAFPSTEEGEGNPDESLPKWLQELREEAHSDQDFDLSIPQMENSDFEIPDERHISEWMKDILAATDNSPVQTLEPKTEFGNQEEEDPDWLREISENENFPRSRADRDAPDWLEASEGLEPESNLGIPSEPDAVSPQPDSESPSQLPAWLSKGVVNESEDRLLEPAEKSLISELRSQDDKDISTAVPSKSDLPEPPTASISENILEDSAEDKEEPAGELDYFAVFSHGSEIDTSLPESLELPGKLVDDLHETGEKIDGTSAEDRLASGEPASMEEIISGEVGFDFRKLEQDARLTEGAIKDEIFTGDLSWLNELEPDSPDFSTEQDWNPEEGDENKSNSEPDAELPGWEEETEEMDVTAAPSLLPSEDVAEEISPAELPGWLMTMRPVGSLDLDGIQEKAVSAEREKAGPLAGLEGALPAEPDIIQFVKPPAYSLKLHFTESQQAHAELLSKLIEAEGEAIAPQSPPLLKSQSLLRMVFALILFSFVVISLLAGISFIKPPPLSSEVMVTNRLVGSITPGSPVLVAVDYAPGFSGELESVLTALSSHLISKGGYLALISTTPTGTTQAQRLITKLISSSDLSNSLAYSNLGFIPGGPSGLRAFAQNPRLALPYDAQGKSAWDHDSLRDVASIADFAMVVVASENPETGRLWIEQIQPLLMGKPVLMVVSSQNSPIIRPYFDAFPQQVQGFLGGISAAVEYETLLGRSSGATQIWTALMTSLTIAVLLVLAGATINSFAGFVERRNIRRHGGSKS